MCTALSMGPAGMCTALRGLTVAASPDWYNCVAGQAEEGGSFKAAKAKQQRAGAGNRAAWNALFMRQDTVAQAIAAHYNVSKADLLDRDAAGA